MKLFPKTCFEEGASRFCSKKRLTPHLPLKSGCETTVQEIQQGHNRQDIVLTSSSSSVSTVVTQILPKGGQTYLCVILRYNFLLFSSDIWHFYFIFVIFNDSENSILLQMRNFCMNTPHSVRQIFDEYTEEISSYHIVYLLWAENNLKDVSNASEHKSGFSRICFSSRRKIQQIIKYTILNSTDTHNL